MSAHNHLRLIDQSRQHQDSIHSLMESNRIDDDPSVRISNKSSIASMFALHVCYLGHSALTKKPEVNPGFLSLLLNRRSRVMVSCLCNRNNPY